MGLLGKILIVLNLLAAGAFGYFATQDLALRQAFAYTAFRSQVLVEGFPLEAPNPAPADLDPDVVPFVFQHNGATIMQTLNKDTLTKILPAGGTLGGEMVADQTAEVKRLQAKIVGPLQPTEGEAPADAAARRVRLLTYLTNLARTGAERDGVIGLMRDLSIQKQFGSAQRDLVFLGRTAPQVVALTGLVPLSGLSSVEGRQDANRVKSATDSRDTMVSGYAVHLVKQDGDKAAREEKARAITNLVDELLKNRNAASKQALVDATETEEQKAAAEILGDLVANPLNTAEGVQDAKKKLEALALLNARYNSEKTALPILVELIANPAPDWKDAAAVAELQKKIDAVGVLLLEQKFEAAAAPASQDKGDKALRAAGEKRRLIAHLLYHIDADRYLSQEQEVISDRKLWHSRVVAIVGLTEYVRTIEGQASQYQDASSRLLTSLTEEQTAFEAEYQARVQRCLFLSSQLFLLEQQKITEEAIKAEHDALLKARETERDELKTKLTKAQEDAKLSLEKLLGKERELFAIQKNLRDAQEYILTLERTLRQLEKQTK